MKKKKIHIRYFSKIQQKIFERVEVCIAYTHEPYHSLSWLGTCTSVRRGGVKSVLLAQAYPFS
jgi:hypothetical protein